MKLSVTITMIILIINFLIFFNYMYIWSLQIGLFYNLTIVFSCETKVGA